MNMNNFIDDQTQPMTAVESTLAGAMMRKVYLWMTMALAISGLTAYYAAGSHAFMSALVANRFAFIMLFVIELGLVIGLSAAIDKLSALTATIMFLIYSVVNGATLSVIFLAYEMGSIANMFFITAGTFAAMALFGTVTRRDLSKLGSYLYMALFGLIIAGVVNVFLHSARFDYIVSIVGVLVFTGLTAYDVQKIRSMIFTAGEDEELSTKVAIIGALTLYLDFVNLFLYLLRIGGNRK